MPTGPAADGEKKLEEEESRTANIKEGNGYGLPERFDNELDAILSIQFEAIPPRPESWGDRMPEKEEFEKCMREQAEVEKRNKLVAKQAQTQKAAIK